MPLIAVDSFDKLLIKANNSGASFADSSTANPKTVTANGNATQLPIAFTDTPLISSIKNNLTAGFFNGTSDYVQVPDHADWDFGTGNITFEAIINMKSVAGNQAIIGRNSTTEWLIQVVAGVPHFYAGGADLITSSQTLVANTWYHIMVIRTGTGAGQTTLYVNAANGVTGTCSTNFSSAIDPTIGITVTGGTNFFNGWIKEVRLSNTNRAVAAPTTQYTSDSNTKLLLHFNNPATSPIGPAIAFDGTGDYLTVADSADWDTIATDPYTYEFFFKFDTVQTAYFLDRNTVQQQFAYGAGFFYFYLNGSNAAFTLTPVAGKWYHFAAVKEGNGANQCKLYIDGVAGATTFTDNVAIVDANTLFIGERSDGSNPFLGSMREIRLSKGIARYTSNFTPNQSGFTVDANTVLYIKGSESNGVTTFLDSETTPKTITTVGDTKIKYTEDYRSCIFKDDGNTGHKPYPVSTAKVDFFSAFGSGVGYFDGTGDYLTVPDSADWDFGTGDVTLECFVRMAVVQTGSFIECGNISTDGIGLLYSAGIFYCYVNNAATAQISFTPIANTWYHYAAARSGSTLRVFINGAQGYSGANSANVSSGTEGVKISTRTASVNDTINGLADNLRIAKGIARYTATFNPPEDVESANTGAFFLVL